MAEGRRVRLFVVDDHDLFRAGVKSELAGAVELVGDASEVQAAIEMIDERRPDVVLVDVHLPGGGGRTVVAESLARAPEVRFLAISVSDAAEDVIALIRAGARGYVTKAISSVELAEAIRRVAAGDAVFSPRLAGFVLDAFQSGAPPVEANDLDQLTARERDVLRLIARGYTYREAADDLGISHKTIETHVSAVLRKLQLSNRRELTRWAANRNLL
jgi:DNA-binding NarL/FixJ family response regulator